MDEPRPQLQARATPEPQPPPRFAPRPHWTRAEISRLIDLRERRSIEFRDMTRQSWFTAPARSSKALCVKYSKLKRQLQRQCPRWTREEVDKMIRIKSEKPYMPFTELASHFTEPPRSSSAVTLKWNTLIQENDSLRGLMQRKNWESVHRRVAKEVQKKADQARPHLECSSE